MKYLAMMSDPWGVSHYIPKRDHSTGRAPGITRMEAMGTDLGSGQWVFPTSSPSKHQLNILFAACLGVGVREIFRLHTYTFGGCLTTAQGGGAIGLTLTCCVAKLRMINWRMEIIRVFRVSGIEVLMVLLYVDDIRFVLEGFMRGYKWDPEQGKFKFSKAGELRDHEEDLQDYVRVSHEFRVQ